MGNVTTSSSSTTPANKDVNPTVSKLLKGLQGQYDSGVAVYDKSLYPGVGGTTQNAWQTMLNAADNPDYSNAVGGAISDFGDIAAGNRYGLNDPGYATLRGNIQSDVMRDVNKTFGGSGLFGSDSNMEAAGEGLGNALAGLDYTNFQNDRSWQAQAAQMLPGLYSASLAPGAAQGAVGAAQDADALAARQGENDLFRRQNDAGWDALARSSSILSGTAPSAGSNTQNQVPWWSAAIGLGSTVAGAFL